MRRISLAAVAAVSVLTLAACGGSEESDGADTPTTSSTPAAEETTEAPAAEQKKIAVDESITDDVMGHQIKITGLVRDFAAPSKTNIPDGGGEWVLVELDVKAGSKYSGGVQGGFTLYTPDGELAGSSTGIIEADMAAAGFTPWESVSAGEQSKGWQAFQVNTRSDAYQLQYKRLAASVIGGGDPIEEKIWKIDLPTS
jgi:hypothetical protein